MSDYIFNRNNYPVCSYYYRQKIAYVDKEHGVKPGDIVIAKNGWEYRLGELLVTGLHGNVWRVTSCVGKDMPPKVVERFGIIRMNTEGFSGVEPYKGEPGGLCPICKGSGMDTVLDENGYCPNDIGPEEHGSDFPYV